MLNWHQEIGPPTPTGVSDPHWEFYRQIYGFIDQIDHQRVQTFFNISCTEESDYVIRDDVDTVIFSTFVESPRYETIRSLAEKHKEKKFIWLADVDAYDYPFSDNVRCIKYRHWFLLFECFFDHGGRDLVVMAKNKKFPRHKFSSLSYYKKQSRAIATAILHTMARSQSLMSWHALEHHDYNDYLIRTALEHPSFEDLDWSFLDTTVSIDDYGLGDNQFSLNIMDIKNPAYSDSAINLSNETVSYGWFYDGEDTYYTRPGPWFTEKTFKPLISGTALLAVGQPDTYQYLKNDYGLPINYDLDLAYDVLPGDFDRFKKLRETIETLISVPITEIVDRTIESCHQIQQIMLEQGYTDQFWRFNRCQDAVILEELAKS